MPESSRRHPLRRAHPVSIDFRSVAEDAILGSFDGVVSIVGLVYSGLAIHASNRVIAAMGLGAAVSATVSMTDGDYEASEGKPQVLRRYKAASMLIATLIGSMIPVWAFWFFGRSMALGLAGIGCMAVATWIGKQKKRGWRGYLRSYVSLVAASLCTLAVVTALPGSGG